MSSAPLQRLSELIGKTNMALSEGTKWGLDLAIILCSVQVDAVVHRASLSVRIGFSVEALLI
jgi:hypothetical protein